MTLISKYTHLIIRNEMEFKFDGRDTSEYRKSISDILRAFKDEIETGHKISSGKLRRLENPNNIVL